MDARRLAFEQRAAFTRPRVACRTVQPVELATVCDVGADEVQVRDSRSRAARESHDFVDEGTDRRFRVLPLAPIDAPVAFDGGHSPARQLEVDGRPTDADETRRLDRALTHVAAAERAVREI